MSQQVTITIKEASVVGRFVDATFKQGKALEQPKAEKLVYNLQADTEEATDQRLTHDSYNRWLSEAVNAVREYMTAEPVLANGDETTLTLLMPGNWEHYAPNAPGLKYAMLELIHNGMLADWYDETKQDLAKEYQRNVQLNKSQIVSIVYSQKPPTVTVTSSAGTFSEA